MKLLPALALLLGAAAISLRAADFSTDGHQAISAHVKTGTVPLTEEIPAGTIFRTPAGVRLVLLRTARAELAAGSEADLEAPAAALSWAAAPEAGALTRTAETEPRLQPLLTWLATRNDVPRATSQCVVLALLENVTFAQWQKFQGTAPEPSVAAALDAVAILRELAPGGTFQLVADPELKMRALRQVATRARALQIFGLTIPGDTATAGQTPPDLGALMHTKAGDNCPICRMREQMRKPASDL